MNNIFRACENDDVEKFLVYKELINSKNEYGSTPLIVASFWGSLNVIKIMLKMDVVINDIDRWGSTALFNAACRGYTEIVELLLQNGADINIKNIFGNTAYRTASVKGYKKILELLEYYNKKRQTNILHNLIYLQFPIYD